jgi:hypothetical protein
MFIVKTALALKSVSRGYQTLNISCNWPVEELSFRKELLGKPSSEQLQMNSGSLVFKKEKFPF